MEMSPKELGAYLKKLRESKGFTTREVYELSNVSNSYLSLVENGKRRASAIILKKLAPIYGVDYMELYEKAGYAELMQSENWISHVNKTHNINEINYSNISKLKLIIDENDKELMLGIIHMYENLASYGLSLNEQALIKNAYNKIKKNKNFKILKSEYNEKFSEQNKEYRNAYIIGEKQIIDALCKIANIDTKHFDCNIFPTPIDNKLYMCPVYGRIAAGVPNWAEQCMEGRLPLDPDMMNIHNPEECFFLRVSGESMNKVVKNGGYALIRKQEDVDNGDIAVVLVNGYDATLKKITRKNDMVILEPMSDDSSFEIQIYDRTTQIKILGKYIGKFEMN